MTPGVISNNGCPVIEKKEQEVLNTAFNNLEFQTGKSVILESSYAALDNLAALMTKKPEFRLLIVGHTDNVGRYNSNLSLSQNRALAVKKYIASKGIKESRMDTKWYGDTKPIGDNNTPEGRKKNRRVELTVIFD
jgi:outer membrane protein OmpA-like peptidoglycan-associated protein